MADAPVLVAGAGIAGLAAALALAARGFQVDVLERASRLEEAGAGIQLSPNAARRLFALGLEAPLRAVCARPERVDLRDARTARPLAHVRLGAWAETRWGAPYLTCHRADLQRVLLDAVQASDAVTLRTGAAIAGIARADGGVTVSLAGATETITGRFLVGADGVRSSVRAFLHPRAAARPTGLTAWRRTVPPGAAQSDGLLEPDRVSAFLHPRAHLVAYPMRGGRLNAVAIAPTSGSPGGDLDRTGMEAAFADAVAPLRACLAAPGWTAWPILLAPAPLEWTDEKHIALVGDAAHAVAPFAAQGAAMAVEDAVTLADALAATREAGSPHVAGASADGENGALRHWEHARRVRLGRVEARGRLNRLAWHAAGPVALARNLVLRLRSPERLAAELDWLYGG